MTSFIGRRHELAETRRRLSAARLVTLVGPGGVGKTRLAIRAASDLARGVPDGAWLVQLAELRDPALIGNAVLAALDLRDQGVAEPVALLRSYLENKEMLLVLDNCEHLLPAANHIARYPQVGAGEAYMWGWLEVQPPHDIRAEALHEELRHHRAKPQQARRDMHAMQADDGEERG